MSDNICTDIQVYLRSFDHYFYEEIFAKIRQIVNPNSSSCEIDEIKYQVLAELFSNFWKDYLRGPTVLYFIHVVRDDSMNFYSLLTMWLGRRFWEKVIVWLWLISAIYTVHCRWTGTELALRILRRRRTWATRFVLIAEGTCPLSRSAEGLENSYNALSWRKPVFRHTLQTIWIYKEALEYYFAVHFVDVHKLNIDDDKMPSDF